MTTDTGTLIEQRKSYAAAYKQASEQLQVARGTVQIKSLETALWGWRWGSTVNALHGTPTGKGGTAPSNLTAEQTLAYAKELGVSTRVDSDGQIGGRSKIRDLRLIAARVATEDHLRELVKDYGNISMVIRSFDPGNSGLSAEELKAEHSKKNCEDAKAVRAFRKFAPPQEWISSLMQRGYTSKEIGGIVRAVLIVVGPEEAITIWKNSGFPV